MATPNTGVRRTIVSMASGDIESSPLMATPPANTGIGEKGELVYAALRRAIIEQALMPATKLPEDAIGERFGVSRTIVRAAFARLAVEGLIEQRPNRGAVVASPSLAESDEIFEVRTGLERLVVEQLCGRLSPEQQAELNSHVDREDSVHGRDGPESIRLAGEFHILLAAATGNRLLTRYISEVVSRCSLILALYGRPHSSECAATEHRSLTAAIAAGHFAEARELIDRHLQGVASRALLAPRVRAPRDIGGILAAYLEHVS